MIDASTQTFTDAVANHMATDKSALETKTEHTMIDVATQTEDDVISKIQSKRIQAPGVSSPTTETAMENSRSKDLYLLVGSIAETQKEGGIPTSEESPSRSSSGNLAPDNTLVNTLTQDEAASTSLLSEKKEDNFSAPLEETGISLPKLSENVAAAEVTPMVQENVLRTEEAAHQRTREDFTRLERWCNRVENENMELQTQVETLGRERATMRRQFHDKEDAIVNMQTALSDAEKRREKDLKVSSEVYLAEIEGLRQQVVDLNADLSWYMQRGTDLYVRLQKAKRSLDPTDRVYAGYQRLMSDAAEVFAGPAEEGNGNHWKGAFRFKDLDDLDDQDEENNEVNRSTPMFDTRMEESSDDRSANGADTLQTEAHLTASDDEDEILYSGRPMRPGTANRVPISVFADTSRVASNNPSPSKFDHPAQRASPPPTSKFGIDFGFSQYSTRPEEKQKAPKASTPSKNGRGGIEPGRGSRRHGANRAREPARDSKDAPLGKNSNAMNARAKTPQAATAFPIRYNFSDSSVSADGESVASGMPLFGLN